MPSAALVVRWPLVVAMRVGRTGRRRWPPERLRQMLLVAAPSLRSKRSLECILEVILEAIPTMDIQAAHLGCIRIQGVTHLQACQCTGQVPLRLVLTGQLFSL